MSTSPARIVANAANAQHSTGPRTPEGKAISSRNAVKDGLSARGIFVRDEQEANEFQSLHAGLLHDVKPDGALEQTLFDMLVHAAWNLQRVRKLQAGLESGSVDPLLDDSLDKQLARLARHQTQNQRTYFRCLRELERIQSNRVIRNEMLAPKAASTVPVLVPVHQVAKQTQPYDPVDDIIRQLDAEEARLMPLARAATAEYQARRAAQTTTFSD